MERGVAGAEIVGVGAAVEEFGGEFEVAVFEGDDQRAGAGARLFVAGFFCGAVASLTSTPALRRTRTTSARPVRAAKRGAG